METQLELARIKWLTDFPWKFPSAIRTMEVKQNFSFAYAIAVPAPERQQDSPIEFGHSLGSKPSSVVQVTGTHFLSCFSSVAKRQRSHFTLKSPYQCVCGGFRIDNSQYYWNTTWLGLGFLKIYFLLRLAWKRHNIHSHLCKQRPILGNYF